VNGFFNFHAVETMMEIKTLIFRCNHGTFQVI
jgi:hypothetical protein